MRSSSRLVLVAVVALALIGGAWFWQSGGPGAGAGLVNLDFDVTNGESGDVPVEFRINDGGVQSATAKCSPTETGKPNVCRVGLPLKSGRQMVSLRTQAASGWTPWSEPAPIDVK